MQKLEKIQQDGFKNEGYAIEKSIEEDPGNKNEDSQDGSNFGINKRDNEMKIMGKLENSQEHDHKELDEIHKGEITNSFTLQNVSHKQFFVPLYGGINTQDMFQCIG